LRLSVPKALLRLARVVLGTPARSPTGASELVAVA